jgi:hypothetical protein
MDTTLDFGSLIGCRVAIYASFAAQADTLSELIDALLLSVAPQWAIIHSSARSRSR